MASKKTAFPIVGIGASAGGLEALEQFFPQVPADSGMAFVVVQHLDPHHDSMLTEILQRLTTLPVTEAVDDALIEPNHIYIIPPNRDMAILHGRLQLSPPTDSQGPRSAIDSFLQSLAEDQLENAVGIILSGTGTDGTKGLGCILNAGGMTLVQEPTTAKYDGMPSSAIRAGYVTHVLPVVKMLEALRSGGPKFTSHTHVNISNSEKPQALSDILKQLHTVTGHDFSQYKKNTIERRIERRMSQLAIQDINVYTEFIKKNRAEVTTLFKELLINVTSFFRDKEAFELLQQEIVPELCKNKSQHAILRVWVVGCASGEEVYSIAILLKEWMEAHHEFKVQIFGTDLDEEALVIARAGIYPKAIAEEVAPERLNRFFTKVATGYQVQKKIREMVIFAVQNVLKDPPFTRLDLLSCRNLLIYLESGIQNRLISAFNYALKPGGVLFLSPSESIGNHPELFVPINRKFKLYRSIPLTHVNAAIAKTLPWTRTREAKAPKENEIISTETNIAEFTRRALIQKFVPAAVVTDLDGIILFIHGDTGKFLRPAPGQASLNIIEMARPGLELELRAAIRAANEGNYTFHRELKVKTNGDYTMVNLSVRLLPGIENNKNFLLVSFQENDNPAIEKPRQKRAKKVEPTRVEELERELAYSKDNYQVALEEQQTSSEEIKAVNEEMQSANEELQSTNEELETSKEEMQSVNEELVTVNSELQARIEQLIEIQNDMKNLFDSTHIGTIFLDSEMKIRRFTREAATLYRLAASDIGRSLGDIKSNFLKEELLISAQSVLETLIPFEQTVQTQIGHCYLARIQPYRTLDNSIDGVVLTFTDITERNKAENEMQLTRDLAESVVDTMEYPLLVLDGDLNIISSNRAFYQFFQVTAADTIGKKIYNLGDDQWNIPALQELLEIVLPDNQSFDNFVLGNDFPMIGHQKLLINARRIVGKSSDLALILLMIKVFSDPDVEKEITP